MPQPDPQDRRAALAADRTIFAAERTYAAWVRTGLAALASGVGAKALLTGVLPGLGVKLAGTVLTLFSAFCFAAAVWRELSPGLPRIVPDARRIPGAVLYTVNAFLAVVALMAVASIWGK
jgi:putative membrane protein